MEATVGDKKNLCPPVLLLMVFQPWQVAVAQVEIMHTVPPMVPMPVAQVQLPMMIIIPVPFQGFATQTHGAPLFGLATDGVMIFA